MLHLRSAMEEQYNDGGTLASRLMHMGAAPRALAMPPPATRTSGEPSFHRIGRCCLDSGFVIPDNTNSLIFDSIRYIYSTKRTTNIFCFTVIGHTVRK